MAQEFNFLEERVRRGLRHEDVFMSSEEINSAREEEVVRMTAPLLGLSPDAPYEAVVDAYNWHESGAIIEEAGENTSLSSMLAQGFGMLVPLASSLVERRAFPEDEDMRIDAHRYLLIARTFRDELNPLLPPVLKNRFENALLEMARPYFARQNNEQGASYPLTSDELFATNGKIYIEKPDIELS